MKNNTNNQRTHSVYYAPSSLLTTLTHRALLHMVPANTGDPPSSLPVKLLLALQGSHITPVLQSISASSKQRRSFLWVPEEPAYIPLLGPFPHGLAMTRLVSVPRQ